MSTLLVEDLKIINLRKEKGVRFKLVGSNILIDRHLKGKCEKPRIRPLKMDSVTIRSDEEWKLYEKWREILSSTLKKYYSNDPKLLENADIYASEYARNMLSTFTGTVSYHNMPVSYLKRCIEGMKIFVKKADLDLEKAKEEEKSDNLSTRFRANLAESYIHFIDAFSEVKEVVEDPSRSPETIIEDDVLQTPEVHSKDTNISIMPVPISVFSQGVVGDKLQFRPNYASNITQTLLERLDLNVDLWNDDLQYIRDVIPQGLGALVLSKDSLETFEKNHFTFARNPETSFTALALQKAAEELVKAKVYPQNHSRWYASPRSPEEE